MEIQDRIKELSELYFAEITNIRRYLHSHPELSFQEEATSAYVHAKLSEWNIPCKAGYAGGNGIIGWIDGRSSGKVIALRADMDALPVQEMNEVSYRSEIAGKMHACGHDVHMACLLGAAKILMNLRDKFTGRIKLVFQPGEEKIPGGAKLMIEEGALLPDEPELMIAQHVYPELKSGICGFREGIYMASSDEIYITVKGKGGHAAVPEKLIDPVTVTAQIIIALQNIKSRLAPSAVPTVLSFGRIIADGAVNVIPDLVRVEGTFRTMNEEWRAKAHELIGQICENTAKAYNATALLEIRKGYPMLYNNPELTNTARKTAESFLGKANVKDLDIRMTSEDFAYFALKYPSFLYRLGTTHPGQAYIPLHNSSFNIDEDAMKTGMGLLARLAVKFLNNI